MTDLEIIRDHAKKYPLMCPIDAIKLVYQSEYGAGHLINDRPSALKRLSDERKNLTVRSKSGIERIGGGYVRIYLKDCRLSDGILLNIFSMPPERKGNDASFATRLETLRSLAKEGVFSFTADELESEIESFTPIPSHSDEYRKAYAPAYRVADERFVMLIPLIADISSRSGRLNVSIDGRAASGKTTAARLLSRALECPVFHADDYFLPFEMKTPERLSEPGGNLHYERLKREVVDNFGKDIEYTPYDCSSASLSESVHVPASRVNILEGSYSGHPYFGDAFDIRVFCSVPKEVQKRRILERNGEKMLARFIKEWIPMEEKYFETFNIADKCDYLLDNTDCGC
ncbi:MAG: hypothetical protein IJC50_01600 [Clostridia bacterium]|nr:hypothetical protein [Clostridia bacterium]